MLNLQKVDDGIIFRVKVQPASGKNEIVGVQGDALKIKINAPPVKGKANKALIDFLAKEFGMKKSEADAVVYATAMREKAQVVTSDSHFKDLDDVVFLPFERTYWCEG